jgi:hypothetical protein
MKGRRAKRRSALREFSSTFPAISREIARDPAQPPSSPLWTFVELDGGGDSVVL